MTKTLENLELQSKSFVCLKCGSNTIDVKYILETNLDLTIKEYFNCKCLRCKYEFQESVLIKKEDEEKARNIIDKNDMILRG